MILYACSSNPGKLREFALAASEAGGLDLQIEPLPRLQLVPAPEETGTTFEENARLKAIYYSKFTQELIFAEDSGLEVDALGGAPGVFSARFAGPKAGDTLNNTFLLWKMEHETKRTARYVAVIALSRNGAVLQTFRGEVEGQVLREPHGKQGFGYDPLFYFPPFGRTLAEVSAAEKLSVSHRGRAFRKLLEFIGQKLQERQL